MARSSSPVRLGSDLFESCSASSRAPPFWTAEPGVRPTPTVGASPLDAPRGAGGVCRGLRTEGRQRRLDGARDRRFDSPLDVGAEMACLPLAPAPPLAPLRYRLRSSPEDCAPLTFFLSGRTFREVDLEPRHTPVRPSGRAHRRLSPGRVPLIAPQ